VLGCIDGRKDSLLYLGDPASAVIKTFVSSGKRDGLGDLKDVQKISSILFSYPNEMDMAMDLSRDSDWCGVRIWRPTI
jgi:hypothetical protein